MTSDRVRLFAAASVPRRQLEAVALHTRDLRDRWSAARWTPVENQHVTLKFLGSVPAPLVGEISGCCRAIAAEVEPTSLRLDRLGAFPTTRRARVLWVGLADPSGALAAIAAGLDRVLEPLGFAPEKRPFSPHATIARFKEPRSLGDLPVLRPSDPFPLDRFGLWRSHLGRDGATYESVAEFELGAGS